MAHIYTLSCKTGPVSYSKIKMKKILLLILVGVLFPVLAFAQISYSRSPSGYTITNPVSFSIGGVFEFLPPVDTGWKVGLYKAIVGKVYESDCFTTTDGIYTETLSSGEYVRVELSYYTDGGCAIFDGALDLEYNAGNPIFEIPTPLPPAKYIPLPDDLNTSILATIGELFTDLSPLVASIGIGLPVAFWGVRKVISLSRFR